MNHRTSHGPLPSLVADVLHASNRCIDNLFAQSWKTLGMGQAIMRSAARKRSGTPIHEVIFLLLLWRWLGTSSIAMFCRRSLAVFSSARKDAMYDGLKREDINWRALNLDLTKRVYNHYDQRDSRVRAYVLDDSIRPRRGNKLEGVSSHFDHTSGRHVMGHQVLTLGLATDEAFLPVDSQIFISDTKARSLAGDFGDHRSAAAVRYKQAVNQSKPQMARAMLRRAVRHGIDADYVIADAWFGTKTMIQGALTLDLHAIYRMKKNAMKYRIRDARGRVNYLDAKQLYKRKAKKQWRKVQGMDYQARRIEAELELTEENDGQRRWVPVSLVMVRGLADTEKPRASRKDWALFLSTDTRLSICKILETYALRWGIEVYFKEAKQHLGFLKEQTITFASHIASIHLAAMRYLVLVSAMLEGGSERPCEARNELEAQLTLMSFAGHLWQLFRTIIAHALGTLSEVVDNTRTAIMQTIDEHVERFLIDSLQLDAFTLRLEGG